MTDTCCVWNTPAHVTHDGGNVRVQSPRVGGEYLITGTAIAMLGSLTPSEQKAITEFVVSNNLVGSTPQITSENVLEIKSTRIPWIGDRGDRLLTFLASRCKWDGQKVRYSGEEDVWPMFAHAGTASSEELKYLLDMLTAEDRVEYSVDTGGWRIGLTPAGYAWIEERRTKSRDSAQAFVAMWFHPSMAEAYTNGFQAGVADAGFKPLRIDGKEHANKIDDEIVGEIKRSRFVVADFTSEKDKPRGGVYFEAGLAQGLGLPVIWTCRYDCLSDVHFDTRQYNHIVWNSPIGLRDALAKRIRAVIGEGPGAKASP
ncbi:MAG: hypothetical protein WDN76_02370 [Alphaproteobacteria bacterium]